MADTYKEFIPKNLYDAMYRYEVEEDDQVIYHKHIKNFLINTENKEIKKFRNLPYAYNVGAMMDWIDYCPRTWEEIKDISSFRGNR